jgi:hypothetical protein
MIEARERQNDNSFGSKVDVPRGLKIQQFGFCFYDLGLDEALMVECDVPDARYWSFQLYGMHFFEALDLGCITSLNHEQATIGADGRLRLVLAHRDPGVPNWLDTLGRRVALLNFRHFWGSSALPTPETQVMPLAEVRAVLPSDTPMIDAAARETEVRERKDHLAWRFRT